MHFPILPAFFNQFGARNSRGLRLRPDLFPPPSKMGCGNGERDFRLRHSSASGVSQIVKAIPQRFIQLVP